MTSQTRDRLILASFFGALWLCFAGTWLGWGQFNPADERRELAPVPRFDRTFPEGLGLYLRDHFGFRGAFVTLNALIRVKLLHTSTTPNVIMGEEGFLFFAGEGAIENYMGLNPMTDCEVSEWVSLFERRAGWLASRHIPFVMAVVPNKETVYPEMMPAGIPRGAGKSRMDRFVEAIRSRTRVPPVDLRPVLIGRKKEHRTYYPSDTHWSQWGAYWAYREMLQVIQKAAPGLVGAALELSDLKAEVAYRTFDLDRMLGLNAIAPERVDTFEPMRAARVTGGQDDPVMTSESDAGPRLVFVRDSFGAALMPYLGVHFSRIYAPNGWTFDPSAVARERADLVILEIVERRLNDALPVDQDGVRQFCAPANRLPLSRGTVSGIAFNAKAELH